MQLPSTAEQKPHVLVQCEQRNLVASQLGGGVPTGKGWRPKQGFSMGQYGVRLWHAIRARSQARSTLQKLRKSAGGLQNGLYASYINAICFNV